MRKFALAIGVALLTAPTVAAAQSAAEIYSYKAPSGMFGEGTTMWQTYRFRQEDRERTAKLLEGQDVATGSLSNSSSNEESYPRPGERSRGYRRPTSR